MLIKELEILRQKKILLLVLSICFWHLNILAQQTEIDSLKKILKSSTLDTNKAKVLYRISALYIYNNSDSSLKYAQHTYNLSRELNYKNGKIKSIGVLINAYRNKGNLPKALELGFELLEYYKKVNYKNGVAIAFHNLGAIKSAMGDLKGSIEYNLKALKIREELCDSMRISHSYVNLGIVYEADKQFKKSIEASKKAYAIQLKMNNDVGAMYSLMNLGNVYTKIGNIDTANNYFQKAYNLYKANPDEDKSIGSNIYTAMAKIYLNNKELSKSLSFSETALKLAKETRNANGIAECYDNLADICYEMKDYKHSLEYYQKSQHIKDSLFSSENITKSISIETKYKDEQEKIINELEKVKKESEHQAEVRQQKIIIWSVVGGLLLIIGFSGLIFRALSVTRKQKQIIEIKSKETEQQKLIIEEKNKDITDSINYAKRIQQAILPPAAFINKYVPNNFVLYKPKDIVAGDFYWAEEIGNLFFIAAADSTGHGVPGAMVSVVCSNALNRAVKEFSLTDTGKILDKTRELVIETFAKSNAEVKDGMDISLLCIDSKSKNVFWSGANNPLWYIQDVDLKEIKADKQPIGKTDYPKPFTTHQFEYKENTTFYLFTDGLADQFGGPNGKKFKYKQFSDLLIKCNNLSQNIQADIINKAFSDWKGDLEQVDDVCVIGIKL